MVFVSEQERLVKHYSSLKPLPTTFHIISWRLVNHGENHLSVAIQWQTLSYKFVSSTPWHAGGDRNWLLRYITTTVFSRFYERSISQLCQ